MPVLTAFTEVCVEGPERMPEGAAAVPVLEDVGSAISQLPVAHGGFCYIDHKGNASSQNANDGRSNPSLAGIEIGPESRSHALTARPNGS